MSRWMYAVAWRNENGKRRQKEFLDRSDAEALIAQVRAKGQPYTFERFCRMRLWDRLWLAKITWPALPLVDGMPIRYLLALALVLAAPVALLHPFR